MAEINIEEITPNINIDTSTRNYHLPIASADTLGGIKVGNNLTIEEDGTLNAESTEYNLPIATASTLGGIKVGSNLNIDDGVLTAAVDSVLANSTNPVQNSVVSSAINTLTTTTQTLTSNLNNLSSSVSLLSGTVTSNTDDISTLQNDVSGLGDDVDTNTTNIENNTNDISDLSGSISLLDGRLDTDEANITDLQNGATELTSDVNLLKHQASESITNSYLLPVSTWTDGSIQLERRGKMGTLIFDLTCTLNLHNTDVQIYTLTDNIPNVTTYSTLLTDNGVILCKIDDLGVITLMNPEGSSKTITHVYGQVTVVYQ